jgi:hypothetical protein
MAMISRIEKASLAIILSSSGCSEDCARPSGRLSFEAGEDCSHMTIDHDVSGTITISGGGFRVDDASGQSLRVLGLTPKIPYGTLVRVRLRCRNDVWGGGPGQFVHIDNVPAIDGMSNPTEDGTRLWLVAAGGSGRSTSDFPFALQTEVACTIPSSSDDESDGGDVERLTVTGEGFSVTAEPEEVVPFTIATGPYAGKYQLHNVHVADYEQGHHIASVRNFMITRAE